MPSNVLHTIAVEPAPSHTPVRKLPEPNPEMPIVEDGDASRDVCVKEPVILLESGLPVSTILKAIRRIQKNEAQSWGLFRSRSARQ